MLFTKWNVVSLRVIKRAHQLSLNQIREIVIDSDSDKEQYDTSGMEDEEMAPRPSSQKSHLSQAVSSSDFSANTSEDDNDVENMASQQPQSMQWTLPPYPRMRVLHPFTGAPKGKSSEAAHVTAQTTPLSVLMLFFTEIITLLVVEMNCYHYQFLDNSDDGPSSHREVTRVEMFTFLALTLQMGHTVQGRLEGYWMKIEQLCCPFCGQMVVHAGYYHILHFLHFTDNNRNGVDRTDDRLWKI